MKTWTRVALISKPKNLNGWVVCRQPDDLAFALEPGMQVHFVPPTLKGPRQAYVSQVKHVRDDAWEVLFEGIDSIDGAELISGCACLALMENPERAAGSPTVSQMIGCTLVESSVGEVGEITDVRLTPGQALLVVRTPEGDDVLVPAVDAFLSKVDVEQKVVHATLPGGLLDLK